MRQDGNSGQVVSVARSLHEIESVLGRVWSTGSEFDSSLRNSILITHVVNVVQKSSVRYIVEPARHPIFGYDQTLQTHRSRI